MKNVTTPKPLPFFYIGKDITVERINNYITQKHPILSLAIGKPDTKSIWYPKEYIVKLLEEIELASGDGIRIHLGMYEASHEFSGQICLLINSTRSEKTGAGVTQNNVILENEENFQERACLPRGTVILPDGPSTDGYKKDFNYGSPCPPRCDNPSKFR